MKILILSLGLTFFFSPQAHALTAAEVKSAVETRMRDRHPTPDPNFWTNLGPEAVPILEQMYQETDSSVEQGWILDGLARFSDPSIAGFLESKIKSSDNDVFKKKMLSALIESQGDASLDFVEPYLKDEDPHVRLAVAKGLQRSMKGNTRAGDALKRFNANEKEAWIKKDLEKSANETPNEQKRAGSLFQDTVPVKLLAEKDWAGEWSGVWVSAKKSSQAKVTLTYLEKEKAWKASLKVPKQTAYELKRDGMEVLYYTSSHLHWIEIRNKKDDTVFIGQRKP